MTHQVKDTVVSAAAQVTAVAWVRSMARELLHERGSAKKKKKKNLKRIYSSRRELFKHHLIHIIY